MPSYRIYLPKKGGIPLLYAVSVNIVFRRNNRRFDIIVDAVDCQEAEGKALKQARKLYNPGKKAVYTVIKSLSETEALEVLAPQSQA